MEVSPLDALLSEDLLMVRDSVRDLAKASVAPHIEALDHRDEHPSDLWRELADLGLFSILTPDTEGGSGMGLLGAAVAIEALAEAGGTAGALLLAQSVPILALVKGEDGTARARNLSSLQSGECLGAIAWADQVPGAPGARAEIDGDCVRLFGHHVMVPFPGRAGLHIVKAVHREASVVVVLESGAAGRVESVRTRTQGLHGLELGQVQYEAAEGRLLGGPALAQDLEDSLRILVGALLVGIGRSALAHATRYAAERKQFGLELSRFGAMRERLARGDAEVEAARAWVYLAAQAKDRGEQGHAAAARARLLAGEAGLSAADHAVQIYGGYGYSREYPVERTYRDARFLGFGEGLPSALHNALAADKAS